MRAFIAIAVPPDIRGRIAKVQEGLDMLDIDVKLVEPENLHYNIKFLGEVTEADIAKVTAVLDQTVPQYDSFNLRIAGLGAFPQATYARVAWLGAKEGAQQLTALAEAIELALADAGFRREEKQFTPHLTLARISSGQHKTELITLLTEQADVDIGIIHVNEVILFKSELTPNGPVYTPMHRVKLP